MQALVRSKQPLSALVTKAISTCLGIGRQIAQDFGRNGVKRLFLVDLSIPSLQETKALLSKDGGSVKVELFEADIADEGSVSAMVTRCVEVFGRLDVAVNNAGRGVRNMKTAEVAVEDFDNVCAVNLYGVRHLPPAFKDVSLPLLTIC